MEMKKYKLGDILELQRGYDLTSAEMKNANIPVAGSNGVIGYHDVAKCITPCITVGRSGSVGKVHFYRDPVWVHNTALYVSNFKGNDPKYLYYLLSVLKLDVLCGSSVVPSLNRNVVYPMEVPFCSDVGLQNKISSILSTLDQRIENLRAQNRVLEQTAKIIYDYTFLQCAGHQTTYNKTLNRNIPADWEIDNLYRIADFTNGLACQKYRPTTEKYKLPVIKIREMHEGITADTEFVRSDIPEKVIVNPGDLLFSWSASLEVMMWNGVKGGLNQHIFKVTPKEYFSLYFVYFQLKDYIGNFKRMAEARKTTMGHITTDHLNQSRIAIPDEETMKRFSSQVTPLFKKQLVNSQQIETLTTQRNTLLPLLMTGQIEV